MRVVLLIALLLLQAFVPAHLSAASVSLTEIISPLTFSTFTLYSDADGWSANPDSAACDLTVQRVTHVGTEVFSLAYQQPIMPVCSDVHSLNWMVTRDRLAVWLNASASDTSGNGTDVTSSLVYGLRYALSEHLSWTVQGLAEGSAAGTQTIFLYSPSPDWYLRWLLSGWSFGDGTSSTMQQVELGYQGHPGPQVSVMLGRQSLGLAELDTTTFTLGTSLHDVSVRFNYASVTATMTTEEFSAVQALHYPVLSFTFPINGWWWTVSETIGEVSNLTIGFYTEDGNLSGDLSLVPLGFSFSYGFKF